MQFPAWAPAYRQFELDPAANLWVAEYDLPGRPDVTWTVFSLQGRWIADVALPRSLHVLQVGSDFLLGLTRDSLDLETVELLRLSESR